MSRPKLTVDRSPAPLPTPRGPLMDAARVAAELFNGTVTEKWVRANVPGRMKLSHKTIRWYRDDVVRWIEQRRSA